MTHTAIMPAVEASTRDPFDVDPMLTVPAGRATSIVPGRRLTGRQLMRRLRADALLDDRLSNARALPLGARPVLEAVAELMAASPEPGVYRPDPELDGPIYEQIARRLRFHGGEAEVEGHFGRLVRAGLLLVGEGDAIVWPVAVLGTATGVTVGALDARSLDTGGRPRRHETKEQARERRLAARHARGDAQRNMTLVIPGGRGSVPSRAANLSAETQNTEVRFLGEVSTSETSAETRAAGSEVSSRTAAAVADLVEVPKIKKPETAAATESDPTSAPNPAEVSKEVSAAVSGEVLLGSAARNIKGDVELIVAEAARLHGIAATEQARLTARSWLLERGLSVESALEMLCREGRRAPGAAPIRVLHWFDCKVAHYLAAQHRTAASAAAAASDTVSAPLHPEIAARPEWARQSGQRQSWLKTALEGWGLAGSARRRKLKFVYDLDRKAWALFAAAHPEAWEVIGVEPPSASP